MLRLCVILEAVKISELFIFALTMAEHSILIITNRVPYPLNDGGNLAMYSMVEGFHQAGWKVHLFSMNTSRHYVPAESLPELFREISFETFDINTDVRFVPTLRNFLMSKKPNHADRFYSRDFEQQLRKVIINVEPDLIQLESVYLATYLPLIRECSKAPVSLRLHNIEYQIWERLAEETPASLRKFYLRDLAARIRKFEIAAWQDADVLIPITETDAAVVRTQTQQARILVAPYGLMAGEADAEVGSEWSGYHIGAMDWVPNAEAVTWFLETVWPELHRQAPDFRFYFAGRNMPYSFNKYNGNGVQCVGEVPDARAFIRDKKILIVPLKSGGGIRIKILEAMAAGKLVISTAIGMQGIDQVEHGVHYLAAESEEDFRKEILWAIGNKKEAASIAASGTALVRRIYDERAIARSLVANLEEMIAGHEKNG